MIVYQLPSGKIIYLTVEQFLRLTDDEIKQYEDSNIGSSGNNPFRKLPSSFKDSLYNDEDNDIEDTSIDFTNFDDDAPDEPFDINNFTE